MKSFISIILIISSVYSNNYNKFVLNDSIAKRILPLTVDNSLKKEFPPIINQIGGSCAQASAIGYNFTYEKNMLFNTSANDSNNIVSYLYTYNFFTNRSGTIASDGYKIAKITGCPSLNDFNPDNTIQWMSGYEKYYNASKCLVDSIFSFDSSDIITIKHWLYDKGTGTNNDGGLLTFSCNMQMSFNIIKRGKFYRDVIVTSALDSAVTHAMTIVGYSDEISCDINNDGRITNHIDLNNDGILDYRDREIGAFRVVNSWGTNWCNSGKVWIPYCIFYGNDLLGIKVKENNPKLMMKVSISHPKRRLLSLGIGFSNNIDDTVPTDTISLDAIFNHFGANYPIEGYNNTIELGFDVSKFYEKIINKEAKFFLLAESYIGSINSIELIDYTENKNRIIAVNNCSIYLNRFHSIPIIFNDNPTKISNLYDIAKKQFISIRIINRNKLRVYGNSNNSIQISIFNFKGTKIMQTIVNGNGYINIDKFACGKYLITINNYYKFTFIVR